MLNLSLGITLGKKLPVGRFNPGTEHRKAFQGAVRTLHCKYVLSKAEVDGCYIHFFKVSQFKAHSHS